MRRVNRFGLIAVLAVIAVAAPAFAANVTVGHFYTELAKAKQIPAVDAASAEASLRAAGFRLPDLSLGKTLTEGDVTSISNSLGLAVKTSRPSELISDNQMTQFMSSFSGQLGSSSSLKGADQVSPTGNDAEAQNRHHRHHDHGHDHHDHHHDHHHNHSTCEPH